MSGPVWTGDTGLPPPPPPPSPSLCVIFFLPPPPAPPLFLHVSPRRAHAADTEPCGSVTLSRQLRSALLWSGAAARYYNQGQGGLTAGCWGRHIWMPARMSVQTNGWINKRVPFSTNESPKHLYRRRTASALSSSSAVVWPYCPSNGNKTMETADKNPLKADVNKSVCCWRALCHTRARLWMESDGRACFFTALGKMPRCLQLSRPHVFDKLVVRLLRLMHISQKSVLPSFLCDLPVGHDKPPSTHRSIKPNISRTMQIMTNSIILHYALSR